MTALEAMRKREAASKAAALRKKQRERAAAEARIRAKRAKSGAKPKRRSLKGALGIIGRKG